MITKLICVFPKLGVILVLSYIYFKKNEFFMSSKVRVAIAILALGFLAIRLYLLVTLIFYVYDMESTAPLFSTIGLYILCFITSTLLLVFRVLRIVINSV